MTTITIPKTEYLALRRRAKAYERLSSRFFESIIKDPIDEIVDDFRKTDLYSNAFLEDLEDGLRKSSVAIRKS